MSREQILDTFRMLAQSQGFYGRLLNYIDEAEEEDREAYLNYLESKNFKDSIDLIMFIEC